MTSSPTLQFKASVLTLEGFSKVYSTYTVVKENKTARYGLVGLVMLVMVVLILLREPTDPNAAHRLKFDPYTVLGVQNNATTAQINRAFRQLALRMHPDKLNAETEEEAESHRAFFVRVQQSAEILKDAEKRKNYDEFGNPEGPPEDNWWEESYPDWIMHPGKKFIAFYVMLVSVLIMVPFCAIFLVPALEEPMGMIVSYLNGRIAHAEKLLLKEKYDAAEKALAEAQQVWDKLLVKFPNWAESLPSMVVEFRIVCRSCQLLLVKEGTPSRTDQTIQQEVNKLISGFKNKYIKSDSFGSREATSSMLPFALDVKTTLASVGLSATAHKSILKNLATICKKVL